MKILANENIPGSAVELLRRSGHDVLWARTEMAGADDEAVLRRAQQEKRLLLTHDKDFGELAFHRGLPSACGVILFRIAMRSPAKVAESIVDILESRTDWTGYFAVIEEHRTRLRPLPQSPRNSR